MNKSGSLKVRVIKVGEETVLSQIVKLVTEAQASKAPIQKWRIRSRLCLYL